MNDITTATVSEDINVVALTPAEMVPAQRDLVAWCDRKIQALKDEGDELELHQKLAIENGWRTSVVTSSVNRNAKRIIYYQKMQDALKAGYLLVPNMPVDVLAVRVKRQHQPVKEGSYTSSVNTARPQLLPSGEGRYVDETTFTESFEIEAKDREGKPFTKRMHRTGDYDEVDFPIALTKPIILEAAARAMALRVFDQIGRVQNGGGRDPILVGQLIDPHGNGRMASFFIAWWVDTSTL